MICIKESKSILDEVTSKISKWKVPFHVPFCYCSNDRSIWCPRFSPYLSTLFLINIGPNGFAIISGYDLGTNPPGVPTPPATYGTLLTQSINAIVANAGIKTHIPSVQITAITCIVGKSYYFSLGIPAAASDHEFTNATRTNGDQISGL